jgi:hypothetical protein
MAATIALDVVCETRGNDGGSRYGVITFQCPGELGDTR